MNWPSGVVSVIFVRPKISMHDNIQDNNYACTNKFSALVFHLVSHLFPISFRSNIGLFAEFIISRYYLFRWHRMCSQSIALLYRTCDVVSIALSCYYDRAIETRIKRNISRLCRKKHAFEPVSHEYHSDTVDEKRMQ